MGWRGSRPVVGAGCPRPQGARYLARDSLADLRTLHPRQGAPARIGGKPRRFNADGVLTKNSPSDRRFSRVVGVRDRPLAAGIAEAP